MGETLDQLLEVATRRRWWVIFPAFVVAMATCLGSRLLPNRYRSEAIILVERQLVPQPYAIPKSTSDMREALQGRTEVILTRTRLLQIIDEFGLYQKERKKLAPEELAELMRSNIEIQPIKKTPEEVDLNAFKISFTGNDARVAQAVASRLTALFIAESTRSSDEVTSLEKHQQGQQFLIIDPPGLPIRPLSPDHVKISLEGLVAGLALGAVLAFLVEFRDHSFRDDDEIRRRFAVPLVVSLPLLLTQVEERRRARLKVLEWFVGVTLGLIVCATEFYVLRRG